MTISDDVVATLRPRPIPSEEQMTVHQWLEFVSAYGNINIPKIAVMLM